MSPDFWIRFISYIDCDNDEVWSLDLHDIEYLTQVFYLN